MTFALLVLAALPHPITCQAIALHDVDGPIRCSSGTKIRLQGIGATETDGSCRLSQPCIPGDPIAQRRTMATRVIGATIAREDAGLYGQAWFAAPVPLSCVPTGKSHGRVTAWCRRADGTDLSCGAITAGVAARWPKFDRDGRLSGCAPRRTIAEMVLGRLRRGR